jgi:Kef-type K+ transport system membrane component KefB
MFLEFAGVLLVAALIGLLAARLRQPMIVAFIVVGILVGPAALGWVSETEPLELLAQLGVTVLLFLVGLKLDPALVRRLGPVALATGLGQLAFTIVFGYLLGLALGMDHVKAIYVAVALTFSSTIIIVKLLSDKRELDTLHGRIATGFLIVQDIAVVLAMMVIGSWGVAEEQGVGPLMFGLGRAVLALLVLYLMVRYLLPRILHLVASSGELLLVFSVAWGAALAAAGEALGFSKEVGAFLAGFALAGTAYREAIGARLASLRDFLLLFFFVDLGAQLQFADLGAELLSAGVLSLFVLIGNPLIVLAIMAAMGYRRRTGFLAGLTVAQISEFSVIFVAMGVALGHIGGSTLSLVTLVGLVTITLSTYMILYSERLYAWVRPWLKPFERRVPHREQAWEQGSGGAAPEVVVYGLGRYGRRLLAQLHREGIEVLGVDYDPDAVAEVRAEGLPVRFGDAEDAEFVHSLPLSRTRWVVATLPQRESVLELQQALRHGGFRGAFAAAARLPGDGEALAGQQLDLILRPYQDAADRAAERIIALLHEPGAGHDEPA